jgi:hypothetical protein
MLVIPGHAAGMSPEPTNTDGAERVRDRAASFSQAGVHGFRALRFAKPRNDGRGRMNTGGTA